MKNVFASLLAVGLVYLAPQAVFAGTGWRTANSGYKPIYYVVQGGCFLVNLPVATVMWCNRHVHDTLQKAADDEQKEATTPITSTTTTKPAVTAAPTVTK